MVIPNELKQNLKRAICAGSAEACGEISDRLRYTYGLNYAAQAELVREIGCSADDYEELLYESDQALPKAA